MLFVAVPELNVIHNCHSPAEISPGWFVKSRTEKLHQTERRAQANRIREAEAEV
jgi:hypothetical protein